MFVCKKSVTFVFVTVYTWSWNPILNFLFRFAKGRSETMQTLQDLVHKGVKVDLGIPYSMWDEPSAAVTKANQYVSVGCHMLVTLHNLIFMKCH